MEMDPVIYLYGLGASLIVQAVKRYAGTSPFGTGVALLLISLIIGGIYYWLKDSNYWLVFLNVLVVAGAVHNFLIRRFEDK